MEETVNKNIEKYQTPSWRAHPSLLGWCQMNYPSHLIDKRQKRELSPRQDSYNLSYLHQERPPAARDDTKIYKPLTNASQDKPITQQEGVGSPPKGFKSSTYTLTTTPFQDRVALKEKLTKGPEYARVRPLSSEIGEKDFKSKFEKPITQVGQIKYYEEPEDEERRHFKRLPNSILTEQSLKELLSPTLAYLNLSNLMWVKNEHLNKLGFLAPNLMELNISGTVANDATLEELGKTMLNLKAIDISHCSNITEKGVAAFFHFLSLTEDSPEVETHPELENRPPLEKFWSANCKNSVTDESLKHLTKTVNLKSLNIEFCSRVTDESIKVLMEGEPPLKELYISGCIKITGKTLSLLLEKSKYQLEVAELSNMTQNEFDNEAMKAVGSCGNLIKINISGDTHLGDDALHNLVSGLKPPPEDTFMKKEEGFKNLIEFRMSGIRAHSEGALLKLCNSTPKLEVLDINGFNTLGETSLGMICKALPNLRMLLLNFTSGLSDPFMKELSQLYPQINFVRNIVGFSDPTDNGLRVPFPKIQKGKKKKKKGKKK